MIIKHQFINESFFFPYWEIDTLVLGTFNPSCGKKTDYFYGRSSNNFWRTIERILGLDFCHTQNIFENKLNIMKQHKFGCIDIIKEIHIKDIDKEKLICGSGYSDQVLFTQKNCKIEYQFEEIKKFIINKKIKHVIYTWGKRDKPKYFQLQIEDLENSLNHLNFLKNCPSPSGYLRSKKHLIDLEKFYFENLIKIV